MTATTMEAGAQAPVFYPITGPMRTRMIAKVEDVERNIAENIDRDRPRFFHRPDYGKWKGKPLAIVAGGPSLNKTIPELRSLAGRGVEIMACGSAHNHIVDLGLTPRYSVQGESHWTTMHHMDKRGEGCEYLIASCCEPKVFDAYQPHFMWHWMGGPDPKVFRGEPWLHGACTITLMAIYVAVMIGYHEMHIFGLDSCFEDRDNQHAYQTPESDSPTILVKCGTREFTTSVMWLAQATHFGDMVENTGHMFEANVYGDGLIAEMLKTDTRRSRDEHST